MSVRYVPVVRRNEEGPRSLPSRVIKSPRPPRSLAVFSTSENVSPSRWVLPARRVSRDLGSAGLPSPGPVAPWLPPADMAPGQGLSLVLVLWVFREQGAGIVGPLPWGAAPPPELGDGESGVCGRLGVAASGENRTRPLQCDFSGRESYDVNVTVVVGPRRGGVQGPVPRSVEHAVHAVAGKPGRGGSWRPVGLLGARLWREAAVDMEGGVLPPPPRVCRRVPAFRFSWPPPPEVCVPVPPESSASSTLVLGEGPPLSSGRCRAPLSPAARPVHSVPGRCPLCPLGGHTDGLPSSRCHSINKRSA